MSDYQRTIEFLRDFRSSGAQQVTEEVRTAAVAYAELCASANERLRQCASLLQRGLRAEAVHQAEASPNLLDLVAALDLPDPQGWVELCQRTELPVPPPLQIDRASQLLDAYGQDQPVAHLYAQHRRLALSHGPLVKRLDIMRQLSQADPSPVWEKDIRVFEAARFKELRVAFATAKRDRDNSVTVNLTNEVLSAPWLEAIPADLATAAADVDHRLKQAQAAADVTEILGKLRSGFAAKSLSTCSALLTQLKEKQGKWNGAGMNDQSAAEVRTVVAWVQQESESRAKRQAFNQACDALNAAIDADAPDKDLHETYAAALNHGQDLPEELAARYDALVAARSHAALVRNMVRFSLVAVVLAIGLGVVYWQMQVRLARDWSHRIADAANAGNLELANQLVSEQERRAPRVSDNTAVQAAKQQVSVLRDQVEHERSLVKGAISQIYAASKDSAAIDATAAPEQVWLAVTSADAALDRAAKLQDAAKVDSENRLGTAVTQLRGQREAMYRRYVNWMTAQINDASHKAELSGLTPRPAAIASAEADLASAEQTLTNLQPLVDRGGQEIRSAFEELGPRIAKSKDVLSVIRGEMEARGALAAATTSAASARMALQQYAMQFPNSTLAGDFLKAAAAGEPYESVDRWTALAEPWFANPAPANEKAAVQRSDAVTAYVRDNPQAPIQALVSPYAEYLRQAVAAMGTPNAWQAAMGELLSQPLMADLAYLEATDKTRWYILGEPNVRRAGLGERVRLSFDAIDPVNITAKKTISIPFSKTLVSEKTAPLPHALFVRLLADQLKTIDDRNWETAGIDLIDRVASEQKIDPVVQAILLHDLLGVVTAIDGWGVEELYDRSLTEFKRQKLDSIVWYDVEHPVSSGQIANLRDIIARLPKGSEAKKMILAQRAQIFKSLRPPFIGLGILIQDEQGKWQVLTAKASKLNEATSLVACVLPEGATPAAPAVVAPAPATDPPATQASTQPTTQPAVTPPPPVPSPAGPPARLVTIGTRKEGSLVIDDNAAKNLPQGTLVFLVK